ncbi:MAG: methyltransferase domain-containing protein [Brevinematales bacterium]|jgi:SAM-dependent methyltransferase
MKTGYLGFAGLAGLLGFWNGRCFSLFFLFLLFLSGIFPKKGKGLVKVIMLFAITFAFTAGTYFHFLPVELLSLVILAWMLIFWLILALYPAGKNIISDTEMAFLCDPYTHGALSFNEDKSGLVNPASGKSYPVIKNLPVLMDVSKLRGLNKKYAGSYNKFAYFYDIVQKMLHTVFYGGEKRKRMQFLKYLNVRPKDMVLETSCGTGGNFHYLTDSAVYHGLDISSGMLSVCLKNLNRWRRNAFLVQGEAENLPYRDSSFDVVFQYGGINYFNDRKKAIDEMIRVAKPGARLMIGDETEQVAEGLKNLPGGGFYSNPDYGIIHAHLDLIPEGMTGIECNILFDGTIYCITFNKPAV